MHGRTAPIASEAYDPNLSSRGRFCCDAQCRIACNDMVGCELWRGVGQREAGCEKARIPR